MSSKGVNQLLQEANQQGNLSRISTQLLAAPDLGEQIKLAMGMPIGKVDSPEVVILQFKVDDSGSIRNVPGNTEAVREGCNLAVEAQQKTKQAKAGSILASLGLFNRGLLYDIRPIAEAEMLDDRNYDPNGGTPLYDQVMVMCGTAIAKAQEWQSGGVAVRTINIVITDGHDEHSSHTIDECAQVVRDMLGSENHIIAGIGINDGRTDFQDIFTRMGIPPQWILTPKNTASEIRHALNLASESAVRASQGAANFSKMAIGGFGK